MFFERNNEAKRKEKQNTKMQKHQMKRQALGQVPERFPKLRYTLPFTKRKLAQ